MANKTESLFLKLTPELKEKGEKTAKEWGVKFPDFVRDSIEFYASFSEGFLSQMNITASSMKLPIPVIIENLLMTYIAADSARLDVFGVKPKAFQRAFLFTEKGLITGAQVSEICYEMAINDAKNVKKRLEIGVERGEMVQINTEEAIDLLSALVEKQGQTGAYAHA